jgi:hypothetical protein
MAKNATIPVDAMRVRKVDALIWSMESIASDDVLELIFRASKQMALDSRWIALLP